MIQPTSQNDLAPSGFFAVRTPLLPFDELLAWSDGLEAASAGPDPAQLEAAYAADRARLRQRLRKVFARPETREALFVASPELEERFEVWLHEPDGRVSAEARARPPEAARPPGAETPEAPGLLR